MKHENRLSYRVSSKDILDQAEIRSGKTLTRWYSEHGLIPPPEIDTHPSGRGKMAYWPAWVLRRCIRIRQLIKSGHSLDEICEILGTDWDAEARRAKRRYSFTEASKMLDKSAATEKFAEAVVRTLPDSLRESKSDAEPIEEWLVNSKNIEQVLALVGQGQNPILVLNGERRYIVPDFVVGQMLAKAAVTGGQWWVTSLYQPAYEAFKTVVKELEGIPRIKPVARIVEYDDRGSLEQEIRLLGPFDHETVGRRRRRKT